MLELNLARRAPTAAPLASETGVTVTPLGPEGRLAFRIKPAALSGQGTIDGFDLSGAINSRTASGDGAQQRVALRLGPDEWMLLVAADEVDERCEAIAAALPGAAHALVDVSHREVSFSVEGPGAADVVNAGCPLDLSSKAFPAGSATRTILGKAEIVLQRLATDSFTVTTWRSFAPYVQGFLVEATRA